MKKCTGKNCPMQVGYDVEKCAAIDKCPYRTWPVTIADRIEAQAKEIDALRNELCLKCGNYTLAHEGACNGCRWRR